MKQGIWLVVGTLAAAALAVALVFAGLLACMAPVTTRVLAQATSLDEVSVYTKDELVELACVTRSYVVGTAVGGDLLNAQGNALAAAIEDGRLDAQAMPLNPDELRNSAPHWLARSFRSLPEQLVLDSEASTHLDDCRDVITAAVPVLGVVALVAFALLGACAAKGGRRVLGGALLGAGAGVLGVFVLLGGWALVDFDGFFEVFHGLFFAEGTWKFPWDSLLICMYPDAFWYGMAAVWAATTCLLAAGCVIAGLRLRK